MGSSFLVNAIRAAGARCIEKPIVNTVYCADWPEAIRRQDPDRRPTVQSLQDLPTKAICRQFRKVQLLHSDFGERFTLKMDQTLDENFAAYLSFLAEHGIACVLRGTSVSGRLSAWRVSRPIFLIRHPLQSYISYAKPERHLRDVHALGGSDARAALEFWSWSWNALASEYIRCLESGLEPVLIRYETVHADAEASFDPVVRTVFSSFRPHTNPIELADSSVRYLRDKVSEAYFTLYDRWELD
jgi:hypothetical protein